MSRGGQERGFTLMELLVVIGIAMLTITAAALTLRNIFKSDLRSAARRTAAAMRFAFDRATLTGTTVRLVFDIDKGEIWAESTEERVFLAVSETAAEADHQKRETEKRKTAEAKAKKTGMLPLFGGMGGMGGMGAAGASPGPGGKGPLGGLAGGMFGGLDAKQLTADWEKDLEPPEKPPPSFEKLKGPGSRRIKLGSGIKIADVVTPRFTDPVEKGAAQVYFFPQGRSEPAIIHFMYKDQDYYSVLMQPLSGQAKVYPCYLQTPPDFGIDDATQQKKLQRRQTVKDSCQVKGAI